MSEQMESIMRKERKQFEELLRYMDECYDKLSKDDDMDAIYDQDIFISFGNRFAHTKGCAATFNALQDAIKSILDEEYDEYKDEPIGRIVESYDIIYTGGGIYVLYGFLRDGRFICGEIPDECTEGGIYAFRVSAEEDRKLRKCMEAEDYTDDLIDEVTQRFDADGTEYFGPKHPQYMLMWKEILDDYAKTESWDKGNAEKWWEEVCNEVAEA